MTAHQPPPHLGTSSHVSAGSTPRLLPAPPVDLNLFVHQFHQTIETESPTADKAALQRSARLFSALGEGLLGTAAEVRSVDGFPHLLWRFGSGPRRVVLIGHHDTVWPLGTLETFPYSLTGGVIRGPGTDDMKGGDLIALHALARVQAQLGHLDGVSLLLTADEETGSETSRKLIEAEAQNARAALVFESGGESGELKVARKGMSGYELLVHGRASHAGVEPEKGVNATVEAMYQVQRALELNDSELQTSVVPTRTWSGTTGNTVPAEASVWIDSRAALRSEQLRVDKALRSLTPVLPGASLELLGGINRPPWERTVSAGLFARAGRIAHDLGHEPLRAIQVGGGSDGNFTAALGVPTLDGLGTVGGGSHARDEHALVEWIVPRIELTAALVIDLLTNPD